MIARSSPAEAAHDQNARPDRPLHGALRHGPTTPTQRGANQRAADLAVWFGLLLDSRVLAGLAAWTIATMLWVLVLNRADLSFAYCLGGVNYIIIPLLSRWLYDEHLNNLHLTGMGLIALGVAMTIAGRALR